MPRALQSGLSSARRTALAAVTAILTAGSMVHAQDRPREGGGGGGGRGGPGMIMGPGGFGGFGGGGFNLLGQQTGQLSQDTVDRYAKVLGFTPEQKERARQAHNAYRAQYETEEAAMQERISQAREAAQNGDPNSMRDMTKVREGFRESSAKLETEFMGQLRAMLTTEQAASWTRLERSIRREKAASGMLVASGEKTDLVAVIEKMELPDSIKSSIDPILGQYEAELDKELVPRAKVNEEIAAKFQEMSQQMRAGGGQGGGGAGGFQQMLEKLQPVIDKAKDASSKVQEVNRRYAAKIQTALPEDRRAAFIRAVKESRFPDVYRTSLAARQLTAALELSDMNDKQKASVRTLRDSYSRQIGGLNDKLAVATEKDEAERLAQPGLGFGGRGGGRQGRGQPSELSQVRSDRRAIEQSTIADLAKILTPAQVDLLPRATPQDRMFLGGGGQFQMRQDGGGNRGGGDGRGRRNREGGGGGG